MEQNKIKEKSIDLSNLPTRKLGNRTVIDWKNINNVNANFKYFNFSGVVNITYEYTKIGSSNNKIYYLKVKFKDKEILMADSNFRKVKFGALLENEEINTAKDDKKHHKYDGWINRKRAEYKYSVNEVIPKQNTNFIIIACYKNKNNRKAYTVECDTCKNQFEDEEYEITNKKVCPYCHNVKIKKGFNDVTTTHPEVVKHVINKNVLNNHSYGSKAEVVVQCEYCKKAFTMKICDLVARGMTCSCYSSSKGESIFEACMRVNNIEYRREYIIDESRKRYDFYLPEFNTLVEIMGEQHYKDVQSWGNSLEEVQNNDLEKQIKAEILNYKYIDIDWSHRDSKKFIEDIKNKLPFIKEVSINLDTVNIPKINQLVELWGKHPYNIELIEREMNIKSTTRKKLMKEAFELGLIKYNKFLYNTNPIVCLNERKVFSQAQSASNYYNVDKRSIVGNCSFNNGNINSRFKSAGKHPITQEKLQWMTLKNYRELYGEEKLIYEEEIIIKKDINIREVV